MLRSAILVVTNPTDETADAVIRTLDMSGERVVRFHPESVGKDQLLSANSKGIVLEIPAIGYRGNPTDFKSVWVRRPRPPSGESLNKEIAELERQETEALINGFYGDIRGNWCSSFHSIRQASYKICQLNRARALGFKVPDFLVSTDVSEILSFFEDHQGRVVCKPLNSHSTKIVQGEQYSLLMTHALSRDDLLRFGEKRLPCPFFVQRLIKSVCDIRTTVIGDTVTSVAIESTQTEGIDTRMQWNEAHHRLTSLPTELERKIPLYLGSFGLSFGAFDFLRDSKGSDWFLECNPIGQFLWMDQKAGTTLESTMASFLMMD